MSDAPDRRETRARSRALDSWLDDVEHATDSGDVFAARHEIHEMFARARERRGEVDLDDGPVVLDTLTVLPEDPVVGVATGVAHPGIRIVVAVRASGAAWQVIGDGAWTRLPDVPTREEE